MNIVNRKNRKESRQKGSALLVSLMVMVGLSLLGLGFVAISETESAIAVNERNATQALAAAEAGAKIAVEWFQDAEWADDHDLLPPNNNAIKTLRTLPDGTTGYYKRNAGELLFDVPFKIFDSNRFFGNVDTADVIITLGANNTATNFLNALNAQLFSDDSVRISDVRVYAPPMPGGTLEGETGPDDGFWHPNVTTSARYGLATIRVTAQKLAGTRVVATRSVKLVVAETPFPTVDGAIETSGSLVGQGNFHVFWGKVLSEKETQVNRPAVGMPWFDAEDHMWYEYGYNSTADWTPATAYNPGDVVNAPSSHIAIDGQLAKFSYRCTAGGTSSAAGVVLETHWPQNVGTSFTEAGSAVTWIAQESRPYRYVSTDFYKQVPWLYSLLGQTIEDPWLHVRARGAITLDNNKSIPCGNATAPHPCDFDGLGDSVIGLYSNVFQLQTADSTTSPPESLEVFFPTMDYEFWKTVAQSGDNEAGGDLYYFSYNDVTKKFVGPNNQEKTIEEWMNAKENGLGAGFYFFDTADETNPQYGKGGTLTPSVIVNSADSKNFQMQGYIYMNAESFGTTGAGNMIEDDLYQMPGEPYRDIGYREVDPVTNKYILQGGAALPAGDFKIEGANNGVWDFQDVNQNGVFDWHVAQNATALTRPNGGVINANSVWLPVPWFPDCTVPDLSDMENVVAGTCSEPHEPYVNMIYPDTGDPKDGVLIGWHDPADEDMRKPRTSLGVNDPVICDDETPLRDCTSNGYDIDGALVTLAPILYGALYNEGGYAGSGNAVYYGAVLMRGNFDASGTPEVFFNECLARGCLESQLEMQRVMITLYETDQ